MSRARTPTMTAPPTEQLQQPRRLLRAYWPTLLLVWVICGIYSAALLKRGWVPHDEGTIGQSAVRVLAGQLPHRDFDDVYTGGLGCLNAAAMKLFGENLLASRMALFLCFLAWVPTVFWIASRFTAPWIAGSMTLLAAAWSIPVYSSAAPSWYNLFLATFGVAAVLRYLDCGRSRWLFAAGLIAGTSFLFKISGLYFVAGVLLFLVFREQALAQSAALKRGWYSIFATASLVTFVAVLLLLVRHNISIVSIVEFVVPGALMTGLCIGRELRCGGSAGRRFLALGRMLTPFLAGVAIPILLFLVPYIRSGAVSAFINGVFVLPARRFDFAARRPPGFGPNRLLGTVVLLALLIAACRGRGRAWIARLAVAVVLTAVFVTSKFYPAVFAAAWAPLGLLPPLTTLATVWVLARHKEISASRQQELALLVSVIAVCTLIQLPFAAGVYFCYIAPLLPLALLALFSTAARPSRYLLGSVLVFYLAFAVFRITPGFIFIMGSYYQPDPQTERLNLARAGGLRVDPEEARLYERLIPIVQEHAGGSDFIYAGPDCPEVYFLSGKQNPTRTLFDFFDPPTGHTERVLATIESHQVKVAAILNQPAFSPPMAGDLVAALRQKFPNSTTVGKFEVRWR